MLKRNSYNFFSLMRTRKYILYIIVPRYMAEAAIVNFYPMTGTLSGHTDHSEHNLAAPLLSISLGQVHHPPPPSRPHGPLGALPLLFV